MINLCESESRAIQSGLLKRKHPQASKLLEDNELLLVVTRRKPLYITGASCILIGIVSVWQISEHFLLTSNQWAIPALLFCVALIWLGLWFAILTHSEYMFVTDSRAVHHGVDIFGRLTKKPRSIPLSDIKGVHFYKRTMTLRAVKRVNGDILINTIKRSHLFPTAYDAENFSEILITEMRRFRNRQATRPIIIAELNN